MPCYMMLKSATLGHDIGMSAILVVQGVTSLHHGTRLGKGVIVQGRELLAMLAMRRVPLRL